MTNSDRLTLEPFRTCQSNVRFEVEVPGSSGVYRVAYGPLPRGEPYAYGWDCTCPSFKFGKRDQHGLRACKHTKHAAALRCGYGWEALCGDRVKFNEDGTCPRCGGPSEVVIVGV